MGKARIFSRVELEGAARLAQHFGIRVVLRGSGEIEFVAENFGAPLGSVESDIRSGADKALDRFLAHKRRRG